MKTHFGYVFFLATILFFLFVIIGSSPLERIDRSCMPVGWAGKALTSVASLFGDSPEMKTRTAMEEAEQSCQYIIYRQFFKDELEEQRRAREQLEAEEGEDRAEDRAEEGGR